MHNQDMGRRDETPATKADIADLAEATKTDIADLARATSDESAAVVADLSKILKGFAKESLAMNQRIKLSIEDLSAVMKTSHSFLIQRMDGFLGRTSTVQTDQKYLIRRVDKLEKRVSSLESVRPD